MASDINVDQATLGSLSNALSQASSSMAALQGQVTGFVSEVRNQANVILRDCQTKERDAEAQLRLAEAALSACRQRRNRSRSSDDDEDSDPPSCDCEERDAQEARDLHHIAQQRTKRAQWYMSKIESAISQYESSPTGAKAFSNISGTLIPEAQGRLTRLNDVVEKHEIMETALTSSSTGVVLPNGHEATAETFREQAEASKGNSTVDKFMRGMNRVKEKQEEHDRQQTIIRRYLSGGDPRERSR